MLINNTNNEANKKTAIVTIGAPGSGKSTYAKEMVAKDNTYVYLERDVLREKTCNDLNLLPESYSRNINSFHTVYYKLSTDVRNNIEKLVTAQINDSIKYNDNIILSNTNLTSKSRSAQHANLLNNGFNIEYKVFNPTIHDLLYQNSIRKNVVREEVVFDMYLKLQHQKEHLKTFENIEFITDHDTDKQSFSNNTEKQCIICDLDGTIAHISKHSDTPRTHFQMHRVHEDEFDDIVFSMVLGLKCRYDCDLIFLTGRTADCFSKTIEWLDENLAEFGMSFSEGDYQLYSRNNHDYGKDFKVKRELYNTFIKDKYEVLAVFDDRPVCVNLWNDLGLKTIAVADQRNHF